MANFRDLTGKRFGRLEVVGFGEKRKSGKRMRMYWNCRCDCGNRILSRTDSLTSGNVKSCGCLKEEQDSINLATNHSHKLTDTQAWNTYYSMKSRCNDRNNKSYKNYGGRGIGICREWEDSFVAFAEWAQDNGMKKGLQIDRINNNEGYSPENCRWVTPKENSRNRRSNLMIEHNGELVTLVEYSEILNIPYKEAHKKYSHLCTQRKIIE